MGARRRSDSGKRRRDSPHGRLTRLRLEEEPVTAVAAVSEPVKFARSVRGLQYRDFITVGLLVDRLKVRES